MRVEDVGSLSPSGDLLAFILAITITVGVLSTFTDFRESEDRDPDPVFILNYLTSSTLLDNDDDGVLEFPKPERFNQIFLPGLEEYTLEVKLETSDISSSFLIINGSPIYDSTVTMGRTFTHSWVTIIESEGIGSPGRISISILKEELE